MLDALAAWGEFTVLGPLKGGHRNKALKVRSGDGVFVAKSSRRSEAALRWLEPVFDLAETAGFRVPRLVESKGGKVLENGWTLEPFLPGRPVTGGLKATAPMIARFHDLAKGVGQRPGFASASALLRQHKSGDIDLSCMPARLVAKLRAAWRDLPEAQTVIHADLYGVNLLLAPGLAPALIDWDEARRDTAVFDRLDPEYNRARTAWEIAACWQIEPDRARRLADGFEGSS